jgi:hypothetical protein
MFPFSYCRHRREPRHRSVYHCRSPKLSGAGLVTPEVCAECPFRDHPGGETAPLADVHPGMPVEDLVAIIEGPPRPWPVGWEDWPVTREAHALASERFLARLGRPPEGRYAGRGIVVAGGGSRFFPSVYVTVRAIRAVGCSLPVQVWYLGRQDEMPPRHAALLAEYGVACVDGDAVRRLEACRILNGWELKVFALLHSPFAEVLLLDADCYPVRDPSGLFDAPGYRERGAIFWPDLPSAPPPDWHALAASPTGRASVESGQVVIDKIACWRALQLAWWYNDHSDYSYLHGYGDKHTFEAAWARLGLPYHRFGETPAWSGHSFLHAGPDGDAMFVHRCRDKFRFGSEDYLSAQHFAANQFQPGLPLERECFGWLAELAGRLEAPAESTPLAQASLPSPSGVARKIRAYLYSCPERREVLRETLARWRATDWGADPVVVQDHAEGPPSPGRIAEAAHRMLSLAASQPADHYLFLEDDLLFNLHLRHNLERWPPLREGWLWMGTLYNPHLATREDASAHDLRDNRFLPLAAGGFYGCQAVVLSRAALLSVLENWNHPSPYDLRLAAIAESQGRPILAHSPSLVQHVGAPSTWGGWSHRACDFDSLFRVAAEPSPGLPPDCGVITAADANYFVGFRLLAESLGGQAPLSVFDTGLTERQRAFARSRAAVLPLPPLLFPPASDPAMWPSWNKPAFFFHSPYRHTLWIDSDCLVSGDLAPLFRRIARGGPFVTSHWSYRDYPGGNRVELHEREPARRFPAYMNLNAGVVGLGRDPASRKVLDFWCYLVFQASRDDHLRSLIGWYDQGALHWALERAEAPAAWCDRRAWNCFHPLSFCDSSGDFFGRLGPHPGDVIVHAAGQPKYWLAWSDREAFDV